MKKFNGFKIESGTRRIFAGILKYCTTGEYNIGIFLNMLCSLILLFPLVPLTTVSAAGDNEEFYSIQAGSYPILTDAEAVYAKLEKNIPNETLPLLRIEKISSYFTIRIGKATSQEELKNLLIVVRKYSDSAVMRKVYFQEERIVKRRGGNVETVAKTSIGKPEKSLSTKPLKSEGEKNALPDKTAVSEAAPQKHFVSDEPASPPPRMRVKAGVAMTESSASCVTENCHQNIKKIARPHAPVQKMACLACHVEKSPSHPNSGRSDFALAEPGAALCFRCHEPMPRAEVIHAPMREGSCLACHLPHGGNGPALMPNPDDQRDICFKCHDAAGFRGEKIHGPTSLGTCTLCHDPHQSKNKKLLKEKAQDSCIGCHDEFIAGMKKSKFVHPAITEKSCTACHSPHSSTKPNLLRSAVIDLCLECHEKQAKQYNSAKVKHKILYDERGCGNCHQTHYSDNNALLIKEEKELCFGCHGQDVKADNPKKTRNIRKEIEGKKYQHGPVAKGVCSGCHDMHGTENDKLLTGTVPTTLYSSYTPNAYAFCFTCHDKKMLQVMDTKTDTEFRNGSKNLHYLHVVRTQKGRTCRSCHEPHASNAPKLMSTEGVPFGQWRVPVRFEKSDNGGSCLPGCHRRMEYDRHEPVDNNSTPQTSTTDANQKN